jgi:hypothetical protein
MATREIPEHHQWANDLKPGDVVFEKGGFRDPPSKTKVSKVSKTHIYVGTNNTSYPRHTLSHRIDSWTTWYIYPSTPENESKWQLQQTRAKIQSIAYDIYNTKTKRSTIEVMTIEELLVLQGAMETVCGLLDEAAKRVTK